MYRDFKRTAKVFDADEDETTQDVESALERLQRIPVSGLEDLLKAKTRPEIWMWRVALVAAIGSTIYYNVVLSMDYMEFKTIQDLNTVEAASLTFPFIYVCAVHAMNKTYMDELIPLDMVGTIMANEPNGIAAMFLRKFNVSVEYFYENLMKFLTFRAVEEMPFDQRLVYGYSSLLDPILETLGEKWLGWSNFVQSQLFQCESVMRECWFNGQQFSCCPSGNESMVFLTETDICYGITPTGKLEDKIQQSSVGWKEGLRMRTSLDIKHMYDRLVPLTGIRIHFGRMVSRQQTPVILPAGTSAIINVLQKRRLLDQNCIHSIDYRKMANFDAFPTELMNYANSLSKNEFYEVESCTTLMTLRMGFLVCGGLVAHDRTFRPSDNTSMTPVHGYHCIYKIVTALTSIDNNGADLFAEEKIYESQCLPLCDSWHYESKSSFSDLSMVQPDPDLLQNEMVINFANLEYVVETETKAMNFYRFLCEFGDHLGLSLGISMVTIVQIPVHGCVAFWIWRKRRQQIEPIL